VVKLPNVLKEKEEFMMNGFEGWENDIFFPLQNDKKNEKFSSSSQRIYQVLRIIVRSNYAT
jgi:hypothetical protein